MIEELRECPFCGKGESAVEAWQDDYGYWRVSCGRCGSSSGTVPGKPTEANMSRWPEPRAAAVASWNKRSDTSQARLSEAVKVLEEAKTWHEGHDKSLSKQPPTHGPSGNQWARLQHREQIDILEAFLATLGGYNE